MAYFIEMECRDSALVAEGDNVRFEYTAAISRRQISQSPEEYEDDFDYDPLNGTIQINRIGAYLISWMVTSMEGIPTDGRYFQLKMENSDTIPMSWEDIAHASTQLKIASGSGFSVFEKTHASQPGKIVLQNVSGSPINFSKSAPVKAQLLIYGIGENDGDMQALRDRLTYLEGTWTDETLYDFSAVQTLLLGVQELHDPLVGRQTERILELDALLQGAEIIVDEASVPAGLWDFPSPDISGISTWVLKTGYNYNFWADGLCTGTVSITSESGMEDRAYFLKADQFEVGGIYPLTYYTSVPSMYPGWFWRNGESEQIIPIMADHKGLFIYPEDIEWDLIASGDYFRFTLGLVLYDYLNS